MMQVLESGAFEVEAKPPVAAILSLIYNNNKSVI